MPVSSYGIIPACSKIKLERDLSVLALNDYLIFINIDNFSLINGSFGFKIGDEVLRRVVRRLERIIKTDIYKIQADEFAVISSDYIKTINSIREYFLENPITINETKLRLRFSFGVSNEKENILHKASLALRQAKDEGKNRLSVFKETQIVKNYKNCLEWNERLHHAFNHDELVPFFQAIRDNRTGEIHKYEVLIRMVHKGAVYSPHLFLDAAKTGGYITDITKIVIDKSFKFMQNYACQFSINITEEDLQEYYLAEFLSTKCKDYNINPNRVTLEILEGVSSSGTKNSLKQLSSFRKLGFKLSIDDFGTEYSNFERLLEIDVDYIKIDARYIKNIDTDEKSQKITSIITSMARLLGIKVIAEFVHNEAVAKKVEELGIEYSQGYYFHEPDSKITTQ